MKLLLPLFFSVTLAASAQAADAPAPDNTKQNTRDRDGTNVTPGDQGENKSDIAITKAIRQKVMKQRLSMNGKNVKIISVDGVVTLRGPVDSDKEKSTIAADAQSVAGVKQVDNQLEVAAK